MKRIEVNSATGEAIEIQQFAVKNSSNIVRVLDVGETTPDGFTQISDAEAIALSKPDPSIEIASKLEKVRAVRELYLGRILGIKDAARDAGDTATVDACKVARRALLDITDGLLQIPPADIDGVVLQRYQAIVAACTTQMVNAFARVDA